MARLVGLASMIWPAIPRFTQDTEAQIAFPRLDNLASWWVG